MKTKVNNNVTILKKEAIFHGKIKKNVQKAQENFFKRDDAVLEKDLFQSISLMIQKSRPIHSTHISHKFPHQPLPPKHKPTNFF